MTAVMMKGENKSTSKFIQWSNLEYIMLKSLLTLTFISQNMLEDEDTALSSCSP